MGENRRRPKRMRRFALVVDGGGSFADPLRLVYIAGLPFMVRSRVSSAPPLCKNDVVCTHVDSSDYCLIITGHVVLLVPCRAVV